MKITKRGQKYFEYYVDVLVGIVFVVMLYYSHTHFEIVLKLLYHIIRVVFGLIIVQQIGKYVRKLTGWRRD